MKMIKGSRENERTAVKFHTMVIILKSGKEQNNIPTNNERKVMPIK